MRDLITETISTINSAINNIYTKIDRENPSGSFEERELIERFNELVKIEQYLIDILHPNRHDDYDIPKPKFLRYNINGVDQHLIGLNLLDEHMVNDVGNTSKSSIELTEVEDDYERSDHLKYMVMTQDIKESGF